MKSVPSCNWGRCVWREVAKQGGPNAWGEKTVAQACQHHCKCAFCWQSGCVQCTAATTSAATVRVAGLLPTGFCPLAFTKSMCVNMCGCCPDDSRCAWLGCLRTGTCVGARAHEPVPSCMAVRVRGESVGNSNLVIWTSVLASSASLVLLRWLFVVVLEPKGS